MADVSPLKELRSLSTLILTSTNVTDVSALKELKSLRLLDLLGWLRAGTAESSIACGGRVENLPPHLLAAFPVLGPAALSQVTSPAVPT